MKEFQTKLSSNEMALQSTFNLFSLKEHVNNSELVKHIFGKNNNTVDLVSGYNAHI